MHTRYFLSPEFFLQSRQLFSGMFARYVASLIGYAAVIALFGEGGTPLFPVSFHFPEHGIRVNSPVELADSAFQLPKYNVDVGCCKAVVFVQHPGSDKIELGLVHLFVKVKIIFQVKKVSLDHQLRFVPPVFLTNHGQRRNPISNPNGSGQVRHACELAPNDRR